MAKYLVFFLAFYPYLRMPRKEIEIKVSRIIDGDSLVGHEGGRKYVVRLLYVDAPEKKQRNSHLSANFLRKLKGKTVSMLYREKDFFGRFLGEIFFKEESFNLRLIENGLVTLYPYSIFENRPQKIRYLKSFKEALARRKGIWRDEFIINPGSFRKKNRTSRLKRKTSNY